jgi:hypothetical protein
MKISDDMREDALTALTDATAVNVVCENGHRRSGKVIGGDSFEVLADPGWEFLDWNALPEQMA